MTGPVTDTKLTKLKRKLIVIDVIYLCSPGLAKQKPDWRQTIITTIPHHFQGVFGHIDEAINIKVKLFIVSCFISLGTWFFPPLLLCSLCCASCIFYMVLEGNVCIRSLSFPWMVVWMRNTARPLAFKHLESYGTFRMYSFAGEST